MQIDERICGMTKTIESSKIGGLTLCEAPPRYSQMKVELRNIKHAEFASQETDCFTASVYIDGVKEGEVENSGHGGSNNYHPHGLFEKLSKIAATKPKILFGNGHEIDSCPDIIIGDILSAELEKKSLRRHCSRKTLFRLKDETYKDGEWLTVKSKYGPQVREYLVKKYGTRVSEILNETLMMPVR